MAGMANTVRRIFISRLSDSHPVLRIQRLRWWIRVVADHADQQHGRLRSRKKAFYGFSNTAVSIQIWIAFNTNVLVALPRKRLKLAHSP